MRAFVFTDSSLARYAGQFVWLAIDIENSANSSFLVKFPIRALPMLMVVDPKSEMVALRYDGSPTLPQLKQLLKDGAGIVRGTHGTADEAIARADRLAAGKQPAEAVKAYEQAIADAPRRWPRFGRAAESLVISLRDARDYDRCASRALELYPQLVGTASGANIAATGLLCSLRKSNAEGIESLTKATRHELENRNNSLAATDRADLYLTLIRERQRAKDDAGAGALREDAVAFVEKEAGHARTPEQRAAYDFYRLNIYLALGQPEKAIPMLEQSERDLPNDCLPPERLARVYQAMKKYDQALEASDRALARGYGGLKAMLLFRRAEIYEAKGDKSTAQQTLREAIAFEESLPPGQRSEETIAMMKKKLETM
jgi:tetratricopeptide repeat protein